MSTAIVVALVSGVLSLSAAAVSFWSAQRVARLNSELEEQRHARSQREQAAELRARYRDPLLSAAFDLQSRLYNVVAQTFLVRYYVQGGEDERAYAVDNTLHVLAEYFGWVEILRREVQFLNLEADEANLAWRTAFERVRDTFARDDLDPVLRVFRGDQRAIGELMTTAGVAPEGAGPEGVGRHQCLGYAAFVACATAGEFGRWFNKLRADIDTLAREPEAHLERPVLLQNALVDVLDVLDPDCRRFASERRTRLRSGA
jgi:hypothetical protein